MTKFKQIKEYSLNDIKLGDLVKIPVKYKNSTYDTIMAPKSFTNFILGEIISKNSATVLTAVPKSKFNTWAGMNTSDYLTDNHYRKLKKKFNKCVLEQYAFDYFRPAAIVEILPSNASLIL